MNVSTSAAGDISDFFLKLILDRDSYKINELDVFGRSHVGDVLRRCGAF